MIDGTGRSFTTGVPFRYFVMMKIRLMLGLVLVGVVTSLLACGDAKPPMVPDQEQTAQPDASAD